MKFETLDRPSLELPVPPNDWVDIEWWDNYQELVTTDIEATGKHMSNSEIGFFNRDFSQEEIDWLAGAYDTSLSTSIPIRNHKKKGRIYQYVSPEIRSSESMNPSWPVALTRYGGNLFTSLRNGKPFLNWYMPSKAAYEIASILEGHSLLKPFQIETLINLRDSSPKERVEIAEEFKQLRYENQPIIQKPSLAYIAGWFDATGTIGIDPSTNALYLALNSRSQSLVNSVKSAPQCQETLPEVEKYERGEIPHYFFQRTNQHAIDFLKSIYPYIWVKRDLVEITFHEVALNSNLLQRLPRR